MRSFLWVVVLAVAAVIIFFYPRGKQAEPQAVIKNYAELAYHQYSQALSEAEDMKKAVDSFVAEPSEDKFYAVKEKWVEARKAYGLTEVFRFSDGPIEEVEAYLNAWPLDEASIDYVMTSDGERQLSGIVNRPEDYPEITKELLKERNEKPHDVNVTTGYHAIEFLLWGQDRSLSSAGDRPHTDYIEGEAPNADRRGAYLQVATDLLVEQLRSVKQEWEPGQENYRAMFVSSKPEVSLQKIFQGLVSLSGFELSGERMFAPYDSKSQEDEQSCFSDTTHHDYVSNYQGIHNVLTGQFKGLDGEMKHKGPGVLGLVGSIDKKLADEIKEDSIENLNRLQNIQAPVDAILVAEEGEEKREQFLESIQSLADFSKELEEVAAAFNLRVQEQE